jgi:hypothetical protein
VFAEVELSEPRTKAPAPRSTVVEKEVVAPVDAAPAVQLPIVDPASLPPIQIDTTVDNEPSGPAEPLFGGG